MKNPEPRSTRHPEQACPTCGYLFDTASSINKDAAPSEGDYSLCLNCAQVMKFGPGLRLEVADLDESEVDAEDLMLLKKGRRFILERGLFRSPTIESKWGRK